MTLPEVLLWQQLRFATKNLKFRRQHRIGNFIVDFYCPAARLIVEVDGVAHDMGDRPARDTAREAALQNLGYSFVRLPATAVLKDAVACAESVVRMADPLRQSRSDCHLPMNGEDRDA